MKIKMSKSQWNSMSKSAQVMNPAAVQNFNRATQGTSDNEQTRTLNLQLTQQAIQVIQDMKAQIFGVFEQAHTMPETANLNEIQNALAQLSNEIGQYKG
jgi:predicted transglutaminase-like cysteine proteinase